MDSNLEQFNKESCQNGGSNGRDFFINSECTPLDEEQNTCEYGEELTMSSGSATPSRPSLKSGSQTVRDQASCTKKQFCVYCQKSNTKIARHLERIHSNETDVAYALSFPKRSKRRHMLLEKLRKKGNYQHNIEVIRNGIGDIVMQKQTKRKRSVMEYLPCQYCLAFFLQEGLEKHEYTCRRKIMSQSCFESLDQVDPKDESCFQSVPEPNAHSLFELQSPASSQYEARSQRDPETDMQSSVDDCSGLISQHLETCSFSRSPTFSHQPDLQPGIGPSRIFNQPSPRSSLPTNSECGQCPREVLSDECSLTCSTKPSPQASFESQLQSNELSSPTTDHASTKPYYQSSLVITAESSPEASKESFELWFPSTPEPGTLPYSESSTSHLSVGSCFEEVLRSSHETSLPGTSEYGSVVESNVKTSFDSCLVSNIVYTAESSSANMNNESCHQPIVCQMSSPHASQPSTESCFLASVGGDLRPPPSLELCNHDEKSTPKSSPCCSPKSYQQTRPISGECGPDPCQTGFDLCLSPSPETSPVPHPGADPCPPIIFESCFEPVETSPFPSPESFPYQGVESNMKLTDEPCLTSRLKSSIPPPSSPGSTIKFISQIPSGNSLSVDSDNLSVLDCNLVNDDNSLGSPSKSTSPKKSEIINVDTTFSSSSCIKASSRCETASTVNLKVCSSSLSSQKSSPQSSPNSNLISSTSSDSVMSQHIRLNKTPGNEKSYKKRQFCLYCKKPYIKMARHLSQKHAKETDVAHALGFRKGSKKRLLVLEQIRKKGNYQHNVEVLKSGSGELITCKRPTKDHSVGMYLPCQYCLAFYMRHELWKHERHCKMKTNDNPVCLKRTASSKLVPLQGSVSGELEEAIHSMKQDKVLQHIREDATICKYGAWLFVRRGHGKKHQIYVTQKMRELARFMLAVKELDESVQYFHHVCVPSRLDLVIKGAKVVSGFDDTLRKFERPSLALKIGTSIRQAAEIICGENVMEGDGETVANIKEFIGLFEKNWISCAKNTDLVEPKSTEIDSCLDRPSEALPATCPVSNQPIQNVNCDQEDGENMKISDCGSQFFSDKNDNAPPSSASQPAKDSYSKSNVSPLRTRTAENGKKQFCLYCRKPIIKIARHLSRNHTEETDVARAFSFPKGSKTRHCILKQIRNRGNYQHNIKVQETGKGEIVPLRRKNKCNSLTSYQACPHCLGFFLQRDLWKHQRSCTMKKDDGKPSRRRSRSALSKKSALLDCLSEGCQNIVLNMRDDDVSKYLRTDALICKFGNRLYEKHSLEKEGQEYISQKMRALGRLMLTIKEIDHNVRDLYQVCTESRFSLALEAAKKIGDFDPHSNKFKKSAAFKMGHYLKWATEVSLGENDMRDEARNQAKKFIDLLRTDWCSFEPSPIHAGKQTEEDILHLIKDVVKLQNFLKSSEDKAVLDLVAHPNRNSWKILRDSLLAEITLFNRRRRSVAEKVLLQDYIQRDKEFLHGKTCEPLTKLEHALNGVLIRVGVACKDGRRVPILLTKRMADSLDVLIKFREDAGIPGDNPYMFPQMTGDACIRAHDCVRTFAQNCGASKPEVHKHKHTATIFTILSLNGSEKQQVADLVGEDSFDYQTLDEDFSQLAKICMLVDTIEEGTGAYKGTGNFLFV